MLFLCFASCDTKSGNSKEDDNTGIPSDTSKKGSKDSLVVAIKAIKALQESNDTLSGKLQTVESNVKQLQDGYAYRFYTVSMIAVALVLVLLILFQISIFRKFNDNSKKIKEFEKFKESLDNFQEEFNKYVRQHATTNALSHTQSCASSHDSALIEKLEHMVNLMESKVDELMVFKNNIEDKKKETCLQNNTNSDTYPHGYVGDVENECYFTDFESSQFTNANFKIFNIKGDNAEFEPISFKSVNGNVNTRCAVTTSGCSKDEARDMEIISPGKVVRDGKNWKIVEKVKVKLKK